MAIIPQNVYYGIKTKYLNKFKIDYQGTVATISDLPEGDIPKGTVYNVEANGSNYLWNGEEWDELGSDDSNLVHKTNNEVVKGLKTIYGDGGVVNVPNQGSTVNTVACAEFIARRDTENKSGTFFTRYRANQPQGASCASSFSIMNRENVDLFNSLSFYTDYSVANDQQSVVCSLFISNIGTYASTENNLGKANNAWDNAYISSGQISTSDERFKDYITQIPDAVLDAWGDVSWVQFQFKDALQRKGPSARIHAGAVAQSIDAAFKKHNIDTSRYGFFCHDAWGLDENNLTSGDKYSLRYEEALVLEAAYQRRRADRAEDRIKALEDRLEALEVKLA